MYEVQTSHNSTFFLQYVFVSICQLTCLFIISLQMWIRALKPVDGMKVLAKIPPMATRYLRGNADAGDVIDRTVNT